MRAGKLDREITIQRIVSLVGDAGVPDQWYTAVCTLRAELIDNVIDEQMHGPGASSDETLTFRTRYFPGITVSHRVLFGGEPFDIKHVKELGRQQGLELGVERTAA